MSGIKSDQWIREQCKVRRYWMERVNGSKWSLARHIQNEDEANLWKSRGHEVQQATAEDLKGLSVKLPMIEPFESGQVRTRSRLPSVNERVLISQAEYSQSINKDGLIEEKIVSYGTSSYGYDIRCAPEFKVFTNVHSAVVDPKNFDNKSFVDINADSCVIPPNSFALARSLEYMRIPRDILVVCLGKSTYARCGIIVNVTPLEPEWEGHITLEFSNTTPLPARIYANEGVAQLLFFQADQDDVCKTSYKDRNGKYMMQTGVTLPRG